MKALDETDGMRERRDKEGQVTAIGEHSSSDHSSSEYFRRRHLIVARTVAIISFIDNVPVISDTFSSCFSDPRGASVVLSKDTAVVMTFLFRAVRSRPVRLFAESELDHGLCCLFAVIVVVLSSSLVNGSEFT